ncbi:MAG: signal peptidase II, partial [Patescibacteria group bacterium]
RLLTLADAAAKYASLTLLGDERSIILIPGALSFFLHKNYGALANIQLPMYLIIALSFVVLSYCVATVARRCSLSQYSSASAMIFLIFGATGNLTDRIINGFTTDYLLLFQKSAVNISDGVILGGIIWFVVASKKESGVRQ